MLDPKTLTRKIHTIASHRWVDIDNAACYGLLPRFRPQIFAQNRQLLFKEYDGTMTFEQALEQGILLVDCGKGPTDNHAPESVEKKLSSFSLAMAWLGINDPGLLRIAAAIDLWDTTGRRPKKDDTKMISLDSILEMIEGWNIMFPVEPTKVLLRAKECFNALYAREWSRLAAINDIASRSQWCEVTYRQGARQRQIWVCLVESDQPTTMHVVRNRPGDGRSADVTIVARSKPELGRYQISSSNVPDPRLKVTLNTAVQYLRAAEMVALGDWSKLPAVLSDQLGSDQFRERVQKLHREYRQTGYHPSVPQWFLHEGQTLLLNGTIKHPNSPRLPASVLDPETVMDLVRMALEDDRPIGFPCDDEKRCVRSCPLFTFQLHGCFVYRRELREQRERQTGTPKPPQGSGNVIPMPTAEANG